MNIFSGLFLHILVWLKFFNFWEQRLFKFQTYSFKITLSLEMKWVNVVTWPLLLRENWTLLMLCISLPHQVKNRNAVCDHDLNFVWSWWYNLTFPLISCNFLGLKTYQEIGKNSQAITTNKYRHMCFIFYCSLWIKNSFLAYLNFLWAKGLD
jgi:hypothetical protein